MIKMLIGRHLTVHTDSNILLRGCFKCIVYTHLKKKTHTHTLLKSLQFLCVCKAYNFDQLRDGDLELHCDRVGDVFHWSDELVISSEQLPEQPVLCLG